MSSIAYVTDEKMIEYHRLCGSNDISFWRLSSSTSFKDFRKGDLLFFYAHGLSGKRKGLVGYGHFEKQYVCSLKTMWNRFGTGNGYDSLEDMQEAVARASRNHRIPEKMSCLVLKDVVFFRSAVYPARIGVKINEKLESFTYLDQEDPGVTVRILREAEKDGLDLWSSTQTQRTEKIFAMDEMKHQLCALRSAFAQESYSRGERVLLTQLCSDAMAKEGYQKIRNSEDLFRMEGDTLHIAVPFVHGVKNRNERYQELCGKLLRYKLAVQEEGVRCTQTVFHILYTEQAEDLSALLKELNEERL